MSNQVRIIPDNATIRELNIPKDVLEELQKILSSPNRDDFKKFSIKRLTKGSACCVCGGIPSREVVYDFDGGSRIERYCQSCSERVFTREQVL